MSVMDIDVDLGDDLRLRAMIADDAALLVEATSNEAGPSLWGAHPAGPYSRSEAQAALRPGTRTREVSSRWASCGASDSWVPSG